MSADPRPAGIEAFARCPMNGCQVMVYGPTTRSNYCRKHGGCPVFQTETDEYGIPRTATAPDPSPGAAR